MPSFNVEAHRFVVESGNDLERLLALGIGTGSIEDVELRMARLAGPFPRAELGAAGTMAVVIAQGLFMRWGYRAERVIRTEVLGATNIASGFAIDQLGREMPGLVRRWDAAMDGRTCSTCRALWPDGRYQGPVLRDGRFVRGCPRASELAAAGSMPGCTVGTATSGAQLTTSPACVD